MQNKKLPIRKIALDRYDDFIEARKALIVSKFGYMVQSVKGETA